LLVGITSSELWSFPIVWLSPGDYVSPKLNLGGNMSLTRTIEKWTLLSLTAAVLGTLALPAGAMTCKMSCTVSYPLQLGWFEGSGHSTAEAEKAAVQACRNADSRAVIGEGSCVQTSSGISCSKKCFINGYQEHRYDTISGDGQQDAYLKARPICEAWCQGFPKGWDGIHNGCSTQTGSCMP
jgi:hypothetical protein